MASTVTCPECGIHVLAGAQVCPGCKPPWPTNRTGVKVWAAVGGGFCAVLLLIGVVAKVFGK